MKNYLKYALVVWVMSMSFHPAFAQKSKGFLRSLAESFVSTEEVAETPQDSLAEDTVSSAALANGQKLMNNLPQYSVRKIDVVDESGQPVLNEDGTPQVRYFVVDSAGKVCDRAVAREHVQKMYKLGGVILTKVGFAVVTSYLASKDKSKKTKILSISLGVAGGLALSMDNIIELFKLRKKLKKSKKVLEAYEKNFTAEGTPLDVAADLSDIKGLKLEESDGLSKTAAQVKAELAESVQRGDSLGDFDLSSLGA